MSGRPWNKLEDSRRRWAEERRTSGRSPWYHLVALPILIAAATGIAPYATGAPLYRSIGIGLTLGVVSLLILLSMTAPRAQWPEPPLESAEGGRLTRRWEVPGLDAALERPRYMSRRILVQLAGLAGELLARRGLSFDDPPAREILGDRIFALLTDPQTRPPTRAELSATIRLLTTVAADPAGAPLPIPPDVLAWSRNRWLLPDRVLTGLARSRARSGGKQPPGSESAGKESASEESADQKTAGKQSAGTEPAGPPRREEHPR